MSRPRLLDLFSGVGGAARGYQLAGFHVTGVDIEAQPNYVGDEFIQADAMEFPLEGFDVIHASPPCQAFTRARNLAIAQGRKGSSLDLVEATRSRLKISGAVYVIENVPGAPLENALLLCGSMFGLRVRRHRLFESNVLLMLPGFCRHKEQGRPVGVYNWGKWGHEIPQGGKTAASLEEAHQAMGIDWALTRKEISEAIPPAFTEYIGKQLLEQLARV